jgi:hypothetical protein
MAQMFNFELARVEVRGCSVRDASSKSACKALFMYFKATLGFWILAMSIRNSLLLVVAPEVVHCQGIQLGHLLTGGWRRLSIQDLHLFLEALD